MLGFYAKIASIGIALNKIACEQGSIAKKDRLKNGTVGMWSCLVSLRRSKDMGNIDPIGLRIVLNRSSTWLTS